MRSSSNNFDDLLHEHILLGKQYGKTQQRCSELISAQRAEIEQLQAAMTGLRANAIANDSALAYAREDRAQLEASIPGLPKRIALLRHVEALMLRLQTVMGERQTELPRRRPLALLEHTFAASGTKYAHHSLSVDEGLSGLEASLSAADLVICQTGCLSHGDYWRVHDHCKRTGKTCVLANEPDALRIVRIHNMDAALP